MNVKDRPMSIFAILLIKKKYFKLYWVIYHSKKKKAIIMPIKPSIVT